MRRHKISEPTTNVVVRFDHARTGVTSPMPPPLYDYDDEPPFEWLTEFELDRLRRLLGAYITTQPDQLGLRALDMKLERMALQEAARR